MQLREQAAPTLREKDENSLTLAVRVDQKKKILTNLEGRYGLLVLEKEGEVHRWVHTRESSSEKGA